MRRSEQLRREARRAWFCIVLVGVLCLAAACGPTTSHPGATATPGGSPTSGPVAAGYHVAGGQILDSTGAPFIPDGVQLAGPSMAEKNWQSNDSSQITLAMVQAARTFWHANTTRLQISSANLFAQAPYSTAYLSRIDQIVGWATGQGLNIILSLQYEVTTKQTMPTQDSVAFWQLVAAHYRTNPRVFFDVFNEPSPDRVLGQTSDSSAAWSLWQGGGTGADGQTYVGIQQLVDAIRGTGAPNLVFVEGAAFGKDLRQLSNHLVRGANIVYAIHPYLNTGFLVTPTQWDNWFGNFAASGQAPVVADEWGAFEGQSNNACFPSIPSLVPQLLNYLAAHHIGLIAFALAPGTMIRGWNVTTPTRYDAGVSPCNPSAGSPNMNPNAQGAGEDVLRYLQANAKG